MLQVLPTPPDRDVLKAHSMPSLGWTIPPEVEVEMVRLYRSLVSAMGDEHHRLVQFTGAAKGAGTTRTVLTLAEVAARHGGGVASVDASTGDSAVIGPLRRLGRAWSMTPAPAASENAKPSAIGQDLLLIDTPPIHLSPASMSLAASVGGSVVVALAGVTRDHEIRRTVDSIERCGGRCLGIVLNRRPRRWIGG
jgi:hypothetical protein